MKHLLFCLVGSALLMCGLAACQSDDENSTTPSTEQETPETPKDTQSIARSYTPIELTGAEVKMAALNVGFAFKYFYAVEAASSDEEQSQMVVSPLSAELALGMAANGAAGATRDALLGGLGFGGFTLDEMNGLNKKLSHDLVSQDASATVCLANSVWADQQFSLLDSFKATLSADYDAEAQQVDLATAVPTINQWCADKTNGLISDLLPEQAKDAKAILLNALYFKAAWQSPFKAENTHAGDFSNADGTVAQVSLMEKEGQFPYASNDRCALAELPYGNGAFSLYVVLPDEGVSLADCLDGMDAAAWTSLCGEMTSQTLAVRLPKFSLSCKESLEEAMATLGMGDLFSPTADFSNMSEQKACFSAMWQAATFSVDEKGTEAATATAIGVDTMAGGDKATAFHVQRPFFFLLTEKSTGSVLFMGKVSRL